MKPRIVICATKVPFAYGGAEMLVELYEDLRRRGLELRLSEVHGRIRTALRRAGWELACGAVEGHQTVDAVIRSWRGAS